MQWHFRKCASLLWKCIVSVLRNKLFDFSYRRRTVEKYNGTNRPFPFACKIERIEKEIIVRHTKQKPIQLPTNVFMWKVYGGKKNYGKSNDIGGWNLFATTRDEHRGANLLLISICLHSQLEIARRIRRFNFQWMPHTLHQSHHS